MFEKADNCIFRPNVTFSRLTVLNYDSSPKQVRKGILTYAIMVLLGLHPIFERIKTRATVFF